MIRTVVALSLLLILSAAAIDQSRAATPSPRLVIFTDISGSTDSAAWQATTDWLAAGLAAAVDYLGVRTIDICPFDDNASVYTPRRRQVRMPVPDSAAIMHEVAQQYGPWGEQCRKEFQKRLAIVEATAVDSVFAAGEYLRALAFSFSDCTAYTDLVQTLSFTNDRDYIVVIGDLKNSCDSLMTPELRLIGPNPDVQALFFFVPSNKDVGPKRSTFVVYEERKELFETILPGSTVIIACTANPNWWQTWDNAEARSDRLVDHSDR